MNKYQVICMAFDGEYQREGQMCSDIEAAWELSNNLGSKWYFYPFHFVVVNNTIRDVPSLMEKFLGKRIATVAKIFKELSERPEMSHAGVEEFQLRLQEVLP